MRQLLSFFNDDTLPAGLTYSKALRKQPGLNRLALQAACSGVTGGGGAISITLQASIDSISWVNIGPSLDGTLLPFNYPYLSDLFGIPHPELIPPILRVRAHVSGSGSPVASGVKAEVVVQK